MALKLYKSDTDPGSQAAMMMVYCLCREDIVEYINVNILEGEHLKEEFSKINPKQTVPVLIDGDVILTDSHKICCHLNTHYGYDDDMYPYEPCLRRQADDKLNFERTVLFAALRDAVDPIFLKGAKSITRKSLKKIKDAYDKMEDTVSHTNISDYVSILVGNHISVADLCCIATMSALNVILPIDFQRYPKMKVWWDYLTTRNFYPICEQGVKKFSELLNSKLTKDPRVVMKLYKHNMSPPSHAVMMIIQALGIKDVEYIGVDLLKGENLTEEFENMNPEHTVPVLADDDFIIWDSHAIAGYLISAYGSDESLYPRDPEKRAVIDQRLHFDSRVLIPTLMEAEAPIFDGSATSYDNKHLAKVSKAYNCLEKFLKNKIWIAGEELSVADLTCVSTICFLNVILPVDSDEYPNIVAWIERCTALDFFHNVTTGVQEYTDYMNSKIK